MEVLVEVASLLGVAPAYHWHVHVLLLQHLPQRIAELLLARGREVVAQERRMACPTSLYEFLRLGVWQPGATFSVLAGHDAWLMSQRVVAMTYGSPAAHASAS